MTRTTAADLEHLARMIRLETGGDYAIGYAYGRPRLERDAGSVDVSPRLPKPSLEQWLRAYLAGIITGRRAATDEAVKDALAEAETRGEIGGGR